MKIGFIGTGSMGTLLMESFIQSKSVMPSQMIASNRTKRKVQHLAEQYSGLTVADNNQQVVKESDLFFICVKPHEYKKVIDEIQSVVIPSQILISITSPVLIRHLEDHISCKIAKIIPSITNFSCSGASLCVYGNRLDTADISYLEDLFSNISTPVRIKEDFTRVTSDISSCGPAFLAFFVQQLVDAAVEETGISKKEATRLASEMVLGTGRLLTSGGLTPETLQQRVSVPGGITAEALKMMSVELDGIFNQLIQTTHKKYYNDLDKVESLFYGTKVD